MNPKHVKRACIGAAVVAATFLGGATLTSALNGGGERPPTPPTEQRSDGGGIDDRYGDPVFNEDEDLVEDRTFNDEMRSNLIMDIRGCQSLIYTNNNLIDLRITFVVHATDQNGLIIAEPSTTF